MQKFDDRNGDTWHPDINATTAKQLRREIELDPADLLAKQNKTLLRLSESFELVVGALYILCRKEADGRGVSDEQFGELIGVDQIVDAQSALIETLAAFGGPARGSAILAQWRNVQQLIEKGTEKMVEMFDDPATERLMMQHIETAEKAARAELVAGFGGSDSTS